MSRHPQPARSGVVAVSVDDRWAPESPYLVGFQDRVAFTSWVADYGEELGVDGRRLESSGGYWRIDL
jgi:acetyl esterase